MSRFLSRGFQVAADIAVLAIAYCVAFLFRFEFALPPPWPNVLLITLPYVVVVQYAGLALFGVPLLSWRYTSIHDTRRILLACLASSSVLLVIRLALPAIGSRTGLLVIPIGIVAMDLVLAFLGLAGARALRRLQGEARERRLREAGTDRARVLLIGAGQAGVMVAREIESRPDLGLHAVGFIDDDRSKHGLRIGGLTVLGPTSQLARLAELKHVNRALITIANASGQEIRRLLELCRRAGLETKIIPGIYEIVGDKVNLSRIREVAIEDLLGRAPVQLDEDVVSESVRSRVVMVTGAGGSIGSELCRQICRFGPQRLILVERFENALFEIHRELTSAYPQVMIEPRVADVCDEPRMRLVFTEGRPEVVFHAAAHKHVPMMEWNPGEAIKNNVGGTRVVANLAHEHEVLRFVLISTDKAVNPTSVMGASKRVAEIYLQALSQRSATRFVTVRFGNVLGSAGSVVPIFREQIAKGGPITVTHPEMRRYFMTIPEASQLVLQAGAMGNGGEIFILDMGEPVKIVDLARDLIILSGLRPDEDIEIRFSGLRPGEKLFEELSTAAEDADRTRHPKVFIGRIASQEWASVSAAVEALLELATSHTPERVRAVLRDIVPEYRTPRAVSRHDESAVVSPDAERTERVGKTTGASPRIPN